MVAILAAGRVAVRWIWRAAGRLARVLEVAGRRGVCDSPDELPQDLAVLHPPGDRRRRSHSPAGPRDLPVHQGHGHPEASCSPRTSCATSRPCGWPPPADRADRLLLLPLFHVNAEVVGPARHAQHGACLVLDAAFSRRGFWDLIDERRVTWINAVPAIIAVLAMDPRCLSRAGPLRPLSLRPLPRPCSAGSPAPPDCRAGNLRDDRGGQHDHREPAGRPAQPGSAGLPAGADCG